MVYASVAEMASRHHPFKVGYVSCTWVRVPPGVLSEMFHFLKLNKNKTLNEKQYVSYLGYDFTQYVKTQEDVEKFNKLNECEKRTKGVPLRDCVHDVAEVLNLSRELKGGKRNVHVLGNVRDN